MNALPIAKPYSTFGGWKQFIIHKNKMPADYRNGKVCDAHNPEVWTDYQTAKQAADKYGSEFDVGFVLNKDDPFFVVDIDKCANPAGGWSDTARTVMSYFPGTLVEASRSGKGLHIFGTYTTMPEHACKNIPLGLEFYTQDRFIAFGNMETAIGDASVNGEQYLQAFINTYMPPRVTDTPEQWTTQPVQESNVITDDDELIKKALASKSAAGAFGGGATFRNLWECDVEALSVVYAPDDSDKGSYDESSADAALALQLAFWTGKDCARIERLMWKSKLVRDKWTKHKTYLQNTIKNAVALCCNVYGQSVQATNSTDSVDNVEMRSGFQFLAATQQVKHFADCVYVRDLNRVYTPDGSLLNREQFNATYGGYVFELDSGGSGKTTRKAWEAFTESQAINYPWAHGVCFRPELLK